MEIVAVSIKNKGGRPVQAVKQNQFIGVKCSLIEKTLLKAKAKMVGLSLSEYLRESGLKGQAVSKIKVLPKEVLQLTATLNHAAANLNQIARKRNGMEQLDAVERADLEVQSRDLKRLAEAIKSYLK
jgi:siderophore synthetase component